MDELSAMILAEISNQTLVDHTAIISDDDLAGMLGITNEAVHSAIESLIIDSYLIRLNKNRYSVMFL